MKPVDLDKACAAADLAERQGSQVKVSVDWLRAAIGEMAAARIAHGRTGQTFGLPNGSTL